MPKYLVKRDVLIAHESRIAKEGTTIEVVFPQVVNHKGEKVDMKLGDTFELVPDEDGKPSKDGKSKKDDNLAG